MTRWRVPRSWPELGSLRERPVGIPVGPAGPARARLGLPPQSAVGFGTGVQMVNFSCLAAARNALLAAAGLGRSGGRAAGRA